jgi:hypothetical protein
MRKALLVVVLASPLLLLLFHIPTVDSPHRFGHQWLQHEPGTSAAIARSDWAGASLVHRARPRAQRAR